MNPSAALGPASTFVPSYDRFFWSEVAICGSVATLIALCLIYFVVRYRRRRDDELPPPTRTNTRLEAAWIIIPLLIFLGFFAYGTDLYFKIEVPPPNTLDIYVIGKQWMWKVQHPEGQREINELHVPVGRPVRLMMTSQDAIHSFFVPAFRVKQDVLPGRYTTLWFQASAPGRYHLFCAEYCGAKHSGMHGYVYAMTPEDYQNWLVRGAPEGSLASLGEKLFHQWACANCHHFTGHRFCPNLQNLYGNEVRLSDGSTVIADESYIRESILDPGAKIVEGFKNIMPTFKGQIPEDQLIQLIAYIKAIGPPNTTPGTSTGGSMPGTSPYILQPGFTDTGAAAPEAR
jgi:cytochrome c oxidase subunit 2